MADDMLIGDVTCDGIGLTLYASAAVHGRVVGTDYNYSGISDEADRNLHLIEAVQETLDAGRRDFGLEIDDRSWSGRPEDIERERVALRLDVSAERVLIHMNATSLQKSDPAYAAIATRALEQLRNRGFQRNV